jgi:uncharacterized membrane protein
VSEGESAAAAETIDDRDPASAADGRELDRVGAFSDGVFAFAITLLVLNLDVPTLKAETDSGDKLWTALQGLDGDLTAYLISFAVIGSFWYGHHKVFSLLDRSDGRLVFFNLILLAVIALMPFTTDLIGTYGDNRVAAAIYAANLGAAALADGLVEIVAAHRRLAAPGALRPERELIAGTAFRAAIFFLSIPIAFLSVTAAQISWLLLILVPRAGRRLSASRSSAP